MTARSIYLRIEQSDSMAWWECLDCGQGEESSPRGRQRAYNHARRKGHEVEVRLEKGLTYTPKGGSRP